jgi:hypothetical protein
LRSGGGLEYFLLPSRVGVDIHSFYLALEFGGKRTLKVAIFCKVGGQDHVLIILRDRLEPGRGGRQFLTLNLEVSSKKR